MKSQNIITTDLSDFGSSERSELIKLLQAWREQGLPKDFDADQVVPTMNKNSGFVFLSNSNYEVAMMNGDKLEQWFTCSNCGYEGFAEDCQLKGEGCNECKFGWESEENEE